MENFSDTSVPSAVKSSIVKLVKQKGDNMGRPKRFKNGSKHVGFRADPDLVDEAKRKAENQGASLSEILRDYLRTYVGVNSRIEELKRKKKEAEKELEKAKSKVRAVEKQLEKEKERVPDKYVDYWERKSAEMSESRKEEFLRNSADNLDMTVEEFKRRLLEKVGGRP